MSEPSPEDLVEALESPLIPYYIALGRFLTAYAHVEGNTLVVLRHCSKVTNEVGQCLFAGTRASAAIDFIKRIADAQEWTDEQREPLEIVTAQLGEITRARNDILHYGTNSTGKDSEWYTTNEFVAHTSNRIRRTKITPDILGDMTHDCMKLSAHIVMIGTTADPSYLKVAGPILGASWRYKRAEPDLPRNKNPAPRQE